MALVKTVEMRVLADAGNAQAKLDELDTKAKGLDGNAIKMRFRVDSEEGKKQLDDIRAKADRLGFKDVNIKVRVDGAGKAIAELEAVKREAAGFGGIGLKTLGGGGPGWLGPALLAIPAAATLGGVAAGAGAGLAGAFVAGAGALAAFGAVAKPVLGEAKNAAAAAEKAQNNYNAAIAAGAKPAAAYKTEQAAIAKAYADMSPAQVALSKQLGAMSQAWQSLKAAQTPVVAGALQPWLKSVTDLTKSLVPVIAHVSPVIQDLGVKFDRLIGSSAFRGFRDFIASTGSALVSAGGGALADFIKGVMTLLPQFDPLIREAAAAITRFGTAFASWAGSKKASDEIQGFLRWFSQNGPVVGGLLKNIGGALKNLLPGLTAGGIGALNAMSAFFGLIAKLPKGLATPLATLAGVLLALNKLGVVNVGLKLLGMNAAETAAAGGAAGLWGKLLPGVRLAGGALVAVIAVDMILKNTSSGKGKNWFDNPFGMPGPHDKASSNNWLTSFSPYERFFSSLKSGAALAVADVIHQFAGLGHGISSVFHGAGLWFSGLESGARSAGGKVVSFFSGLPGKIKGIFAGAANWLTSAGSSIVRGLESGAKSAWSAVTGWLGGLPGKIEGFFAGAGSWLFSAGQVIVQGLISGLKSMLGPLGGVLSTIAGLVTGHFPRSPAKMGPLSGQGSPDIAGAKIAAMLASGMDSGAGLVARSAGRLAGAASISPAAAGYGRGGGDVHVHFNGVVGDPNAAARQVVQVIREYKRHGGGAALGIA